MKLFLKIYLGFAAAATVVWAAPEPREETVSFFENRKLTITVPPGIACRIEKDLQGQVAVRMAEPDEKISLSITLLADPDREFESARARREKLVQLFNDQVPHSTEQGMQFEELEPRMGAGTYCTFTDARLQGRERLPPGEFMHLTIGVKAWPGVVVIFELLSQDTASKEHIAIMTMLRESVQEIPVPLR